MRLSSVGGLTLSGSAVTKDALALAGTEIITRATAKISATQMNVTGTSLSNAGDLALSGMGLNSWALTQGYSQTGMAYAAGDLT